ncbi:MAG: PKD domain-containing protein [Bacteroidia bacterium]|nr:PKD domain-containing protein [Bacteroidia bacterium]
MLSSYVDVTAMCGVPTPIGSWQYMTDDDGNPINAIDVTPCPTARNKCDNPPGSLPGIEESVYFRDYDVTGINCQISAYYEDCCRNSAIQNISSPGGADFGVLASYDLSQTGNSCNNTSPYFLERPIPYFCSGDTLTINQLAVDLDSDSLVYRLGNPMPNTVSWAPGYGTNTPLGNAPRYFSLNSATGEVTIFSPTPLRGIFVVYVDEYRNGQLIGTIMRDMQYTIINCAVPSGCPPQRVPIVSGIDSTGTDSIFVCLNDFVDFKVYAVDLDTMGAPCTKDSVYMEFTSLNLNGNYTFNTPNFPLPYSTWGQFNWTPTVPSPRAYVFAVKGLDTKCFGKGITNRKFYVMVGGGVKIHSEYTVLCNTATMVAHLDSFSYHPPYKFRWSGPGGVNNNPRNQDSTFSHTYSKPGDYPITLTVIDKYGCATSYQDTVRIPLAVAVDGDAGPDVTVCAGNPLRLGQPPLPLQTYLWTPSTALSDTTVAQPNFFYPNDPQLPDTIHYLITTSKGICTVTDSVMVIVNPVPDITISASDTIICPGDTVKLSASSTSPNVTYIWSTGDTGSVIYVSPHINTTITAFAVGSIGCLSPAGSKTILISNSPTGAISGDTAVCGDQSVSLTGFGAPKFIWSHGAVGPVTSILVTQDTTIFAIPQTGTCFGDTIYHHIRRYTKPTVSINPQNDQCFDGNQYSFSASGVSGSGASYLWQFGDGSFPAIATQPTAQVRYQTTGTKIIKLVVTQNSCVSDTAYITFSVNPIPFASAVVSPYGNCLVNNSVIYYNYSRALPSATHTWDFGSAATPATYVGQFPPAVSYNAPGTYTTTLIVSQFGCADTSIQVVEIYPPAPPPIMVGDTVCSGYTTTLYDANPLPNTTQLWYNQPVGGSAFHEGPTLEYRPDYSQTFYVENRNDTTTCLSVRVPVSVFVKDLPQLDFYVAEDTLEMPDAIAECLFTGTPNAAFYLWDFGDGGLSTAAHPLHQYENVGRYNIALSITDSSGCTNTIIKQNAVLVRETINLLIPTAFSPNGDGVNDYFSVSSRLYLPEFEIVIFSRSSEVVFTSKDLGFQWDGTDYNKKELPEGVYTYRVRAVNYHGKAIERVGTLMLIR